MAVKALTAWPRHTWPSEAEPALRAAIAVDPLDDVKHRMTATLHGVADDDHD
jgi:hypothetical protein